ncbi:MAG: serine/threonine protein kinase, partial [Pirellulales bacterium]
MSIHSSDDFFKALEKSDLLSADQMAEARSSGDGIDDAATLAKHLAREGLISRWQAGQLLAGRTSFHLGKYRLIELLGRGGMGSVFHGRHVMMNRSVALKIVAKDVAGDPAKMDQFLAEARAIAALDHPAIVQAYSVDNEGDRYYIVMEYVDGRDLQRKVEEDGPLDWREAAEFIRQAADGLAHAHGRQLIHCDIKPSNLLVNQQGHVKILDMGLARLGRDQQADGDGPGAAREQRFLGSVDYLAPEQALETPEFDHRAGIYSLGCTLYFLLTGRPPFPEGTLPQKILKHQTQQPRPILTERNDIPPELIQTCRRMMAKEPGERFQDAAEVVAALDALPRADQPETREPAESGVVVDVDGGRSSAVARPGRPGRSSAEAGGWGGSRRTVAAVAAAAVGLLLIAGAIIGIVVAGFPSSPEDAPPGQVTREDSRDVPASSANGPAEPRGAEDGSDGEEGDASPPDDATGGLEDRLASAAPIVEDGPPDVDSPPSDGQEEASPAEGANGDDAAPAGNDPDGGEPPTGDPDQPPTPVDASTGPPAAGAAGGGAQPPSTAEGAPANNSSDRTTEPSGGEDSETGPPPEPPPEPPSPPKDPFENLARRITLSPATRPTGVEALGQLQLAEGAKLHLQLHGGESALKGPRRLTLTTTGEDGGAIWLLQLHDPSEEQTVDLARLGLTASTHELKIEWSESATLRYVGALMNCALSVSSGEQSAWVRFGEPRQIEPIQVDWYRPKQQSGFVLGELPQTDSLRLQVTAVRAKGPEAGFRPEGQDSSPAGGTVNVTIGAAETPRVEFALRCKARGHTIRMELALKFALKGFEKPQPRVARQLPSMGRQLMMQKNQLTAMKNRAKNHQQVVQRLDQQLKVVNTQ